MKRSFFLIVALLAVATGIILWPKRTQPETHPPPIPGSTTPQPAQLPTKVLSGSRGQALPINQETNSQDLTREFAQTLVALRDKPSGPEFLTTVRAADVDLLIQEYRHRTNLLDRIGLTWALALSSDERVIDLFQNTLFEEFNGRAISDWGGSHPDEQYVMNFTVFGLGFLAVQRDRAYEVLKQGTAPAFWQTRIKWTTTDTGDACGILTAMSIHALGVTGRPDVSQVLEQLKKQPLTNTADPDIGARTFEGDVVQAAFYQSLVKDLGLDGFKKWYFRPVSDVFDEDGRFARWSSSSEGQQWLAWVKEREASRNR